MIQINNREYATSRVPVVAICLDGTDPSYLRAAAPVMPHLKIISAKGARGFAESQIPSLTNNNDLTIVTGVPADVNGICGKGSGFICAVPCHTIPSDPLFGYCEPDSPQWLEEIERVDADVILIGHTHLPAIRTFGERKVVNPGSLGQPKMGSPEGRYAVREDGRLELKSFAYPYKTTVAKIQTLPVNVQIRNELSSILRTREIPPVQDS